MPKGKLNPRTIAIKTIKEKLKAVIKHSKINKKFFKELQEFIQSTEPVYSAVQKNHKATHYYALLKYYVGAYDIFSSNLELADYLLKLEKSPEELNSFIAKKLAVLIEDLYNTRQEKINKAEESPIIGIPYSVFSEQKYYENKAYEKLGFINNTIEFLSNASTTFQKTPLG